MSKDTQANAIGLHNAVQGSWRAIYSELNGEMTPVEEFSTIEMEHKENHFTVKKNGKIVEEGRFSINLNTTPHEITYIYSKGPEIFLGAPRVGIVQVQGDTLKTCLGPIGQKPPTDFNTSANSDAVLTIAQRRGSEQGTGLAISRTRAISQW